MWFVDMEKAFDKVPRKSDGAYHEKEGFTRNNGSGAMSLHDDAKTKVRVGSAYSEEFEVKVNVHQGSVLLSLLFAVFVDFITEKARRGVVNELLFADDLVLVNETMEDLKERFWNWKDALQSKGLKVNSRKAKVMVSGSEEN